MTIIFIVMKQNSICQASFAVDSHTKFDLIHQLAGNWNTGTEDKCSG